MKLPAKTRYALKAVIDLSQQSGAGKPVALDLIARRQRIPKKFLVQLMLRLTHAQLVRSVRGVAGGYMLARAPSQITMLDVFQAVDKRLAEDDAGFGEGELTPADRALQSVFMEINVKIAAMLDINFEQLLLRLQDVPLDFQI